MLEEELENELNEISDTEDDDFDFTFPVRTATVDPALETQDLDFDKEMMDLAASTTLRMSSIAPITLPVANESRKAAATHTTSRPGFQSVDGDTATRDKLKTNPSVLSEDQPSTAPAATTAGVESVIPVVDDLTLKLELAELMEDMFFSIEHIAELAATMEREVAEAQAGGAAAFLGAAAAAAVPSISDAVTGVMSPLKPVAVPVPVSAPLFEIHDESDIAAIVSQTAGAGEQGLIDAQRQAEDAEAQSTSMAERGRGLLDSMGSEQRERREREEAQMKVDAARMQRELEADLAAREKRRLRRQAEMLKARRIRAALTVQCFYRSCKALKVYKWKKYTAERLAKERAAACHAELIWQLVQTEIAVEAARDVAEEVHGECTRAAEAERLREAEARRQRELQAAAELEAEELRRERKLMLGEERLMVDMHAHWQREEQARLRREHGGMAAEDARAGDPRLRAVLTSTLRRDRENAQAVALARRQAAQAEQQATLERLQMQFRGPSAGAVAVPGSSVAAARTPTPPPFSAAFGGFVSSVKKIVGAVTGSGAQQSSSSSSGGGVAAVAAVSASSSGAVSESDQALARIIEAQNRRRIDDENAFGRVVGGGAESNAPAGAGLGAGAGADAGSLLPPLHQGPGSSAAAAATAGDAGVTGCCSRGCSSHAAAVSARLARVTLLLGLQQWREHWAGGPHDRFLESFLGGEGSVRAHIKAAWELRGPRSSGWGVDTDDSLVVIAPASDAVDSLATVMQKYCSFAGGKDRAKVRRLDVAGGKLRNLSGVDALVALQELLCGQNHLSSITELQLSPCVHLRVLKLDGNKLGDRAWLDLVGKRINPAPMFPCLETLSMNGNQFTSLPDFGANFPLLSRLELGHNQISCCYGVGAGGGNENINSLRHLAALTYLNLGRNRLAYVDGSLFSFSCPLLTTLILSQNQLTSVPHQLYLAHLKELRLNDNKLTHLNHWCLSAPSPVSGTGDPLLPMQSIPVFLPMLERLFLHDNSIESARATSLVGVGYNLCVLDLSFNNISRLDAIQGLRSCQRLQQLLIHDNPVHALFMRRDTTQGVIDALPCVSATLTSDESAGGSGGGSRTTRGDASDPSSVSSTPTGVAPKAGVARARVFSSSLLQRHLDDDCVPTAPYVQVDGGSDAGLLLPPGVILGLVDAGAETEVGDVVTVVDDACMMDGLQPPQLYNPLLGPRVDKEGGREGQDEAALLDAYTRALLSAGGSSGIEHEAGRALHMISNIANQHNTHRSLQTTVAGKTSALPLDRRLAADITFGALVVYVEGMRQLLWDKLDPPAAAATTAVPATLGASSNVTVESGTLSADSSVGSGAYALVDEFLAAEVAVAEELGEGRPVRRLVRAAPTTAAATADDSSANPPSGGSAAFKALVAQPSAVLAMTLLQAAFRGNRVREKLRRLLESVEYHDDEMDAILYNTKGAHSGGAGGDDDEFGLGDMGEMDAFMNEMLGGGSGGGGGGLCPELDDDWLSYQKPSKTKAPRQDQPMDTDLDASMDSQSTMVYGDHIKKRRAQSGSDLAGSGGGGLAGSSSSASLVGGGGKANISPEFDRRGLVSHPPALHPNAYAAGVGAPPPLGGAGERITVAAWGSTAPSAAASRPVSAMTDDQNGFGDEYSSAPSASAQGAGRLHLPVPAGGSSVGNGMASSRSVKSQASAASSSSDIAQEWGISDPVVLATIMKRNQKLSKMAASKEQRERDKDPKVRYEKFLKTASRPSAATVSGAQPSSSGSFGGKKKSFRPGARRVVATTTPAWMNGPGDDNG